MKIVILGTGKMGSWFVKALSKEHELAVHDADASKMRGLEGVKALYALDEIAAFKPELLINAVSLQNTVSAFEKAAPHLSKNCVISDMASVKGEIAGYYEKSPFRFVSIHPMFGPTFANMDSLREESVIIIKESDTGGAQFFTTFFERLNVRIFVYSFAEHDKMMAYSLTLPFISSMAFAACVDRSAVPGTTFAKHMKIARGLLSEDDHLLGEVLFNAHSLSELDRVTAMMEYLKHIIRDRDQEVLKDFLGSLRKNINP
jgi:prephenate dehydrogenase